MTQHSYLPPGQALYNVVRPLGEGGLGRVDEVEVCRTSSAELRLGERLARKRLNEKWKGHPEIQSRFEREIKIMESLSHPHIVPLRGVSVGGERAYFMPLYPCNLRQWMAAGWRPTPREATNFIANIAEALAYAHSQGCVHRDLKPENILIDVQGRPHVSDWGVGKFIHKLSKVLDLTKGGPMGTSYYASIEQWANGDGHAPGDIYSLGVVLAEVVLGRALPIYPVGAGIQTEIVGAHSTAHVRLNRIVKQMTSLLAQHRQQSMGQVAIELRAMIWLVWSGFVLDRGCPTHQRRTRCRPTCFP